MTIVNVQLFDEKNASAASSHPKEEEEESDIPPEIVNVHLFCQALDPDYRRKEKGNGTKPS